MKLKEFAIALDPKERGNCLGNVDVIKNAHNSFARPEPFVFSNDKKKAKVLFSSKIRKVMMCFTLFRMCHLRVRFMN